MSNHRFHLPKPDWDAGRFALTGDEAHHCLKVFRHQRGDEVEVFDGKGRRAPAIIHSVSNRQVLLEPGEARMTPPLPVFVTLAAAIPKAKTMDLVVQKAAEIGASRIVPLLTERTVVRIDERECEKKREKWQRVALESCKQCGRDWLPEVLAPQSLATFVEGDSSDLRLVAALRAGARPLRDLIGAGTIEQASLLVGPEGDFSDSEYDCLDAAGYRAMTLGPTILRVETATFQGLAILSYELFRG